jgi:hypothetical protein
MRARRLASVLLASAFGLALADSAYSQPPPPTPVTDPPPYGLPDSAPPDQSKGNGPGKSSADLSFACLGVAEESIDMGSAFSYIADEVVIGDDTSTVVVAGVAASGLATHSDPIPLQGATASLDANSLLLQPFDICASSAGSALDSIVVGIDTTDPFAFGMADVDFYFEYSATLEIERGPGSSGRFIAYTGTELEVLGLGGGAVEITADGAIVSAPPGVTITDLSTGDRNVYEVSGIYVIEGQLRYGPGVRNVVKTTFFAGGEVESVNLEQAEIVAGFAAADALDSVSYSIVSLHPNISFSFVAAPDL